MNEVDRAAQDIMLRTGAGATAVVVVNGFCGSSCSIAVHPINDSPDFRHAVAKALEMLASSLRLGTMERMTSQGSSN